MVSLFIQLSAMPVSAIGPSWAGNIEDVVGAALALNGQIEFGVIVAFMMSPA